WLNDRHCGVRSRETSPPGGTNATSALGGAKRCRFAGERCESAPHPTTSRSSHRSSRSSSWQCAHTLRGLETETTPRSSGAVIRNRKARGGSERSTDNGL